MLNRIRILIIIALFGLMMAGCSKHYVITQPLEQPVSSGASLAVGPVEDALPADVEAEDRPPAGDLQKFRGWLDEEASKVWASHLSPGGDPAIYEVTGKIIDYKKGSGVVRFFIGFGLGSSRVVVALSLVNHETGETVFSGNFRREVSDWSTSGDQAFHNIAKDFGKALKKQLESVNRM